MNRAIIIAQVAPFGTHRVRHRHNPDFTHEIWNWRVIDNLAGKTVPVYRGFPTFPNFMHKYRDARPRGHARLFVSAFGLCAKITLNALGVRDCRRAKLCAADGGYFTDQGDGKWKMSEIKCIGLTDTPMLRIKPIRIT